MTHHLRTRGDMTFEVLYRSLVNLWFRQPVFDRGEVHAQKLSTPEMRTRELTNVNLTIDVASTLDGWQEAIKPNLPWAEDHFLERVGGEPLNPAPSEAWWPYAQSGNAAHKANDKFSHTYPERFWPRQAGEPDAVPLPGHEYVRRGIRYPWGDLDDLIEVLMKNPRSRQAYLPIWFPEDLAASVLGDRVPCTLGYHFMLHQDGKLHMVYPMRSCDLVRFFKDDVYMAGRLLQWVATRVGQVPGTIAMNISSLHAFVGDEPHLESMRRPPWEKPTRSYNLDAL